jgi:spore maturation protein CgeB
VLAEHFVPGVELETFDSLAELLDKVRYFIRHPEETAAIARRGQLRAHRDHTYERRLEEIFRVVFAARPVAVAPMRAHPNAESPRSYAATE